MGFSFDGIQSKSMGIASRMATENRVPELKNRTISMAGRDGLVDLGASLSERVIEISCFIPPKRTAAELLQCKDEIVSWLSPDKGVCALMLDTEPGRVYYARLQGERGSVGFGGAFLYGGAEPLLHGRPHHGDECGFLLVRRRL